MTRPSLHAVLQRLRQLAAVQTDRGLSDRELLERFAGTHDEPAFTVLIERHGPMVFGVCRRLLPNFHDAEDACQATFLVLARQAAAVRKKASLGSWLHGVARRVAANLKRDHARRTRRERDAETTAPQDPANTVSWREVQAILDEELQQLPERYRPPLILCYLECLTRDEAARQLGLTSGTLHGRLERGRDLLRARLTKRGLTLAAVMSAASLGEGVAQAALAPTFVVSSTKAAVLLATGQPVTQSVVTTHVLALTQEVLKSMLLTKLKLGTTAVLCAGIVMALLGGVFAATGSAQDTKKPLGIALELQVVPSAESDAAFLRRISKELRGTEPTPAELHFFVANKDAGRRQKLIDLFIQERQARQKAEAKATGSGPKPGKGDLALTLQLDDQGKLLLLSRLELVIRTSTLDSLQKQFYGDLQTAKDKGDVARVTQAYLDRLCQYVKEQPKSADTPQAMQQIIRVYEAQGKQVEANAWREKKLKEHPKAATGPGGLSR